MGDKDCGVLAAPKAISSTFKVPNEFRPAFKQYLNYFNDYIKATRGEEIGLEIRSAEDGLELEIREINEYLEEYLGFIKENVDQLRVTFSPGTERATQEVATGQLSRLKADHIPEIIITKILVFQIHTFGTERLTIPFCDSRILIPDFDIFYLSHTLGFQISTPRSRNIYADTSTCGIKGGKGSIKSQT